MATNPSNINANPTAFFLNQSTETSKETKDKINEYVKKLLNLNDCVLCKQNYNFTDRIPRILVHCGHTICTACLKNFHKNRRVRCPLCLKLIKNIETLDRLPVNHTIFQKMMEERKEEFHKVAGKNAKFSDFTRASIPNRDKKGQYVDPLLEQQYAAKMNMGKPDLNAYYPNEPFDAGASEPTDFKKKLQEFKKQMQMDFNPAILDPKGKNKPAEYQNFMADEEEDMEYDEGVVLDDKFNNQDVEYGKLSALVVA